MTKNLSQPTPFYASYLPHCVAVYTARIVFALTVDDAELVATMLKGFDAAESYSRTASTSAIYFSNKPRFDMPVEPVSFEDRQLKPNGNYRSRKCLRYVLNLSAYGARPASNALQI